MIVINTERAIELLEECIAERGEAFVYADEFNNIQYDTCRYVVHGSCACLIGLALHKAGVPIGDLLAYNDTPISEVFLYGVNITDGAIEVFTVAQDAQDGGKTWGEALERARGERLAYEQ